MKIRVVVDSGQGSLKIAANFFDGDIDPEVMIGDQEGPEEKLTGVNRLLILAEVEGGQERYYNILKLLEKLDIQNLQGLVLVGDLSITNIYLGLVSMVEILHVAYVMKHVVWSLAPCEHLVV